MRAALRSPGGGEAPSCALADDSHASVRLTASLPRCGCSWSRPCTPWRTRATARGLAPGQVS